MNEKQRSAAGNGAGHVNEILTPINIIAKDRPEHKRICPDCGAEIHPDSFRCAACTRRRVAERFTQYHERKRG